MATRNIVPRENNEGSIGVLLKKWASGFIKVLTVDSINKLTITEPASGSTLTIEDGHSLTVSANTTLSGTPLSNVVEDTTPQLGGNLDLNSKVIMPTAIPAADYFSGVALGLIAHQTMTMGQVGYINSSGEVDLADVDSAATMPVSVMATSTVATDATGIFLMPGSVIHLHSLSPAWTSGLTLYAGSGATTTHIPGAISQGVPTGSGDQVQRIGVAIASDILLFNPSPDTFEVA